MLYHDVRKVDNVFYTCAILHNMLFKWDGQTLLQREEEAPDGYGDLAVEATNNEHGVACKAGSTLPGYRGQLLHPEYDGTDDLGRGGASITESELKDVHTAAEYMLDKDDYKATEEG
jgi:hypothetical protein